MSNQEQVACCSPLAREPLSRGQAVELSKVLREAGLITGERRGTWVYYRIQPDALRRLSAVLVLDDAVSA